MVGNEGDKITPDDLKDLVEVSLDSPETGAKIFYS